MSIYPVYLLLGWHGEIIVAGSKPSFILPLGMSYLLLLLATSVIFMLACPPASSGRRELWKVARFVAFFVARFDIEISVMKMDYSTSRK